MLHSELSGLPGIGGGVSLAGLQLAKALGARCIVTSRHAGKLEQARALGADHVIDASREDIAKTVLAATGGRGVDGGMPAAGFDGPPARAD